jgi:feruloyl-CoA synthase
MTAPFADTKLAVPAVAVTPLDGGGWLLRSPDTLPDYADHMIVYLHKWAAEAPDRVFLAERDRGGRAWRTITYGETARRSANLAQALLDQGCNAGRPIAILSDNSIEFALVHLAAMTVGVPIMPVSPAYSLMSRDHLKLKSVIESNDPSMIFVQERGPFEPALAAIDHSRAMLVTGDDLAGWMETVAGPEVESRLAQVTPDTVAKILLTSGSTGQPKGVITTQRMLCSNQAMIAYSWPFLEDKPPVLVDWLPWNHTFGGSFCFNLILYHGGTLYIDEGRPAPGRMEASLRNLADAKPTIYLNVPRGFDLLVPALEADPDLRDAIFENLEMLFFAAAALPQNLRDRIEALSIAALGVRLPFTSSLGSTETAPAATYMTWDSDVWGNIGLPVPESELKLAPNGDRLEARFKGPHITPGYYREPEMTAKAFDDDGFFRIGDAMRFLDPDDPAKGLLFDGRVAENFKLMTGTWVHPGTLRLAIIDAASPVIQDAVVTGHDRDEIGLIIFPDPGGCRSLCPDASEDEALEDLVQRPEIRARLMEGLGAHNRDNPASSTRIARVVITCAPPVIDAGEITDKGYINQRAVLTHRAELVERLYAGGDADIVVI